ncbi:Phospholipase B1, membrane-associated [Varanus komodoensis]|nr:Phospholipase B1, membrane-associated [Varanus komodoensis]
MTHHAHNWPLEATSLRLGAAVLPCQSPSLPSIFNQEKTKQKQLGKGEKDVECLLLGSVRNPLSGSILGIHAFYAPLSLTICLQDCKEKKCHEYSMTPTVHYSPENFTSNIQTALDLLHKEVPRAFVNLVTILNITSLRKLYQEKKVTCPRLIMRSLCSCVLNPDDNSAEIEMLESFNRMYQEQTHHLVESGRYDTREDFTVVVQPLLEKARMPETPEGLPDSSYFAPDCFHFHQKAHSQAARALWNNMLEPLGEKTALQNLNTVIALKCPNQMAIMHREAYFLALPSLLLPLERNLTTTLFLRPCGNPPKRVGASLLVR